MSRTTKEAPDDGAANLHPLVFHDDYELSLVLEPDGRLRDVLYADGVDGVDFFSFGDQTIVEISRRSEDGEARAAEWAQRLQVLSSTMLPVKYRTTPPGATPGQPETVECVATPVPAADGSLEAILLQAKDQTSTWRMGQQLRESEARFRVLAESLPQMVWVADPSGDVVYFSPQWSTFTGRSEDQLLGTGFLDLVHPDDRHLIHAKRNDEGEFQAVVFRLRRHDGEYRWMEADYRVMSDDDGNVIRWVGGTIDVTDRRDHEDAARELQEQLRVALSVTGMGRYALYLRENRITGDSQLSAILGIDVPESVRTGGLEALFSMLHADDVDYVRGAVEAAAAGGPDYDVEYRMWRPTGDASDTTELRWVAARGRVEFDDEGPLRMVGVVEDITERRAEEAARLRWQRREAIGTLASGVAHDFNNVISAILSNASLAETELRIGVSPSTSVAEIARGAERAAGLVQRLLAFSRDESDLEPTRAPFDLAQVVTEACALVSSTLPPDATLERSMTPDLPPVLGSSTEFHRVIVNLLTNAGYAIEGRRGTIRVRVERTDGTLAASPDTTTGPGLVLVQVEDTGPGIPAPVLGRIFDPFFTTKPAGKGTGLGLASVQTIVEEHGGTITAENLPDGAGARFTVLLPACGAAGHDDSNPGDGAVVDDAPTAPGTALQTLDRAQARLVFVDDEAPLVRLAERALPAHGFAVRAFTDPREALAAIAAAPADIDALVTDLSMPGLSGLELIEQVRGLRPDLPVVLSSGFLTAANRQQAVRQGVDAIVPKPCAIADLADALDRLLAALPDRAG